MSDNPQITAPKPDPTVERALALVNKLMGEKSATGSAFRKAAKEQFPDITIPEDHVEAAMVPVNEKMAAMENTLKTAIERLAAREKADDDFRAEADLDGKIRSAQREFGLTDSGRQKMLERMKETGNVTDPQAAAAWVHHQMPKPQATNTPTWLPQAANPFGAAEHDAQFEALHKNPQKYMDDQLKEFVRDPEKYTADTFGL